MFPLHSHQASKPKNILVGKQCNSQWRKIPHQRLHIWLLESLLSSKSLNFFTYIWLFSRKLRTLLKTKALGKLFAKHPAYFQNENYQNIKTDIKNILQKPA